MIFKSPEIHHPGDFMFLLWSSSCRRHKTRKKGLKWSKMVQSGPKSPKNVKLVQIQTCQNASKHVKTRQNASKRVKTHQNMSNY